MIEDIFQQQAVKEIINQVAKIAQYLWEKGWAEKNAGNISVNISDIVEENQSFDQLPKYPLPEVYDMLGGKYFFITGTGTRMRDVANDPLKNAHIIQVFATGNEYQILKSKMQGLTKYMPTSELPTHLAIHQQIAEKRRKEKVIVHTHATELIALTHSPEIKSKETLNKIIWGMHPEAMVFIPRGVGLVKYEMPGSVDIAKLTLAEIQNHEVVLWEKHGVFAIGESVFDTFDSIDIVSKSAKIWFMCRQAGFEPEGLTDIQLQELKDRFGC